MNPDDPDAEQIDGYEIPIDPSTLNDCESCQ